MTFPHSAQSSSDTVRRALLASGFSSDESYYLADKRISSEYSPLSGGQIKRLGLARAIHFPRDILVLDEPTSGLDPHTESLVYTSIENLRSRYKLIIIITHGSIFDSLADYTYDLADFSRYS